jgi:phage terminase large subunit GpA-like protein
MRGVMDAISDPAVRQVVVMSAAQVGKTEVLLNVIGYHIDQDPAPILVVQPDAEYGASVFEGSPRAHGARYGRAEG